MEGIGHGKNRNLLPNNLGDRNQASNTGLHHLTILSLQRTDLSAIMRGWMESESATKWQTLTTVNQRIG